jgi:hypothetical protein
MQYNTGNISAVASRAHGRAQVVITNRRAGSTAVVGGYAALEALASLLGKPKTGTHRLSNYAVAEIDFSRSAPVFTITSKGETVRVAGNKATSGLADFLSDSVL